MNGKVKQNYAMLAQVTGLRFDAEGGALYGEREGFGIVVYPESLTYPYRLSIVVSAQRPTGPIDKEEAKWFKSENKPAVELLGQDGTAVKVVLKSMTDQIRLQGYVAGTIQALVRFLREKGYRPCCQLCGREEATDTCHVGGKYLHLCGDCFTDIQQNRMATMIQKEQKKENVLGGVVGALLGSLIGVVCIVVLSQLGYVAALSGIVMAICTLKGYELLGGKLTRKGIVIGAIVMLLMTFVGDQLDWAIVISRELMLDYVTSFRLIPALLEEDIIEAGAYFGNLALLYLFLLLGAVPTILNTLRNQKSAGRIYRLESTRLPQ